MSSKAIRRRGRIRIDLPVDELIRLYVEERKTAHEIAELFGTNSVTVLSRLHEVGVEVRAKGKRAPGPIDAAEVERLHRSGETVRELARRFRRSEKRIVEVLKATRGKGKTGTGLRFCDIRSLSQNRSPVPHHLSRKSNALS